MRYISESDAIERYNEFLNEIYGEVVVNRYDGLYWDASRVIEEMDPTAYRCGMIDWLDGEDLTTDQSEAACPECDGTMTEDDVQDPDMCDECYGIAHAFDDLEEEESEEEELPEPPAASAEPHVELEPWERELLYPFGEGSCNICGDPDPDHN